jgi:hypothetical protein
LNVTLPPIDAPSRYCPVFTDCIGYGAASKPQNESLDDVGTITTDPGSTFDLGSVDLGCSIRDKNTPPVVNLAQRPVFIDLIASCDIKVTGFRADEPDVLGPVIFKFDPPDPVSKPRALTRVEMKNTRFPSTWTRLNKLTIEVVSTSIRDPTTKVVIDDVKVAVLGPCCTF